MLFPGTSSPWPLFPSVSIVHCNFPSLALTGRYNELEAPQKRLLRYIRQGSHVPRWHKNTIYWDRAVHLGKISADMMGSLQWAFFFLPRSNGSVEDGVNVNININIYSLSKHMVLSETFKERMTIQRKQLCRINDLLRITCDIMSLKHNYKLNNKGRLF